VRHLSYPVAVRRRLFSTSTRILPPKTPAWRVFLVLLCVVFFVSSLNAQTSEWTWIGGSSTFAGSPSSGIHGEPGIYGTLGVSAPANFPGGRFSAATWTDRSGNLWLFGGVGMDEQGSPGNLNDLWKFDPSTKEWTWLAGSSTVSNFGSGRPGIYGTMGTPAPGNIPGGRYGAHTWTDANGDLWLFGGAGFDSLGVPGDLNDLWKYSMASGEWTWIGGNSTVPGIDEGWLGTFGTRGSLTSGSYPGSRDGGTTWTDRAGNFRMFGGSSVEPVNQDGIELNDLWEYVPSTNQWAWISGSSAIPIIGGSSAELSGVISVYGALGTQAPGNTPGSRSLATGWVDSAGNLWLFGGTGFSLTTGGTTAEGFLNDLWEFNPATTEWEWMGGSSAFAQICLKAGKAPCGAAGTYGTPGVPAAGNIPGSRASAVGWTDSSGNFWLFGGDGLDSLGNSQVYLNDLWEFNPASAGWMWMGGWSTVSGKAEPGLYGTLGVANSNNMPGGRTGAQGWTGLDGSLWLMGGQGTDANGSAIGYLNDLWQHKGDLVASFTLSGVPASVTINPGNKQSATLTITPVNGFNAAVGFTCSGLPLGAVCSFAPATVTPSGGLVTSTLTISAPGSATLVRPSSAIALPGFALAGLALLFVPRRRFSQVLGLVVIATAFSMLAGCNATLIEFPTTVTVTASSGSLEKSAKLTLSIR
jgi:N-acetylneuraminic acid mutarotase